MSRSLHGIWWQWHLDFYDLHVHGIPSLTDAWKNGHEALRCVVCCLASADFCEMMHSPTTHKPSCLTGSNVRKIVGTSLSSHAVLDVNCLCSRQKTGYNLGSIATLEPLGLQICQVASKIPPHTICSGAACSRWNGKGNLMNLNYTYFSPGRASLSPLQIHPQDLRSPPQDTRISLMWTPSYTRNLVLVLLFMHRTVTESTKW